MNSENMKNMVVLKDIPSNIVEEAIIILKPNVKIKSLDIVDNKNKRNKIIITKENLINMISKECNDDFISMEDLFKLITQQMEDEKNKRLVGSEDVKKKFVERKVVVWRKGLT